ncbi:MAG: efflux RND transporter periplasmic adaptor subunit [Verrucomicrobia bacterium]|nr:efflux RND transporter periplasmic adaptor subunit [Verrucomicrobiota bacterium]MDA1065755.1 efflux RND transporter periplasmic adaptor subunit [Verrucomicrobiota bacterium]
MTLRNILLRTRRLPEILLIFLPLFHSFGQTPVSVAKPLVETSQSRFQFTGTITSEREAAISPRVAGLVSKADAEMGFLAKKGDLLVSLDDTLARMELKEKELNLEAALAELANSKRRFDEAVELGDSNFPRSERENRETTYRMAEIAVSRMKTMVETQREIVERHRIIAPYTGTVIEKNAEVGEWVQTGNPVLRFVDTENLRFDIQVPQEQMSLILKSSAVTVHIAGAVGDPFDAHIEARSPTVDVKTRTFQVRIGLDNPPAFVKPGMSAEAVFKPVSDSANLFIPRDAILRTSDSKVIVWVAKTSGPKTLASKRSVQLGASSGDIIAVITGLEASDEVIYQGNESLQEGQEIHIVDSIIPTFSR